MNAAGDDQGLLRALLDSAPEAYLITEPSGRVVYANPRAAALFDEAREALVGRQADQLLVERDRAAHFDQRARSVTSLQAAPASGGLELRACRRDGAEVPVEVRFTPLRTPSGVLVAESLRDVSLRRQAEDEARAASIARPLARRIVQDLVEAGGVAHQILQQVGRKLAAETRSADLAGYARAFADMGLGSVSIDKDEGARCSFSGTDLLEKRPGSRTATCAFTLGYLSEAVSRIHGGEPTLGAEIECQSRGAHQCRFIVQVKKQEEGLARRVKELI